LCDLLDLARLEAHATPLTLTILDLNPWLQNMMHSFEEQMQRQQQHFQMKIPPDLPRLTTDASLLLRIVTELLNNACKYTPSQEAIVLTATATEQALHLRISNSGVDLSPQELDRLFETFYRVPSHDPWKHGGTGLGLALVKQQVEQIQGAIAVTNQPGWLSFTLQLPWHID
jgi:signal transduction histidine kinase